MNQILMNILISVMLMGNVNNLFGQDLSCELKTYKSFYAALEQNDFEKVNNWLDTKVIKKTLSQIDDQDSTKINYLLNVSDSILSLSYKHSFVALSRKIKGLCEESPLTYFNHVVESLESNIIETKVILVNEKHEYYYFKMIIVEMNGCKYLLSSLDPFILEYRE